MPFGYFDRGNNRGNEPRGFDHRFQLFLLDIFSESTARLIYGAVVGLIAFLCKVGLLFTLPFMFIKFWREEYRKNGKNVNTRRPE